MKAITPVLHRLLGNRLPPNFTRSMANEDTRRERLDIGLGLWTQRTRRYYPLTVLRAAPSGILDQVDGQTMFVTYNPIAHAPEAIYVEANAVQFRDGAYEFDTGVTLRHGKLHDAQGQVVPLQRPQQMFTRWYGFAFTFPNCDIFEMAKDAS
jgi:hypothetical protein